VQPKKWLLKQLGQPVKQYLVPQVQLAKLPVARLKGLLRTLRKVLPMPQVVQCRIPVLRRHSKLPASTVHDVRRPGVNLAAFLLTAIPALTVRLR
jgi:hypothetical protein